MAAPVAPILGANGKVYRNTAAVTDVFVAAPDVRKAFWLEVPTVRDVEIAIDYTDVDVSSRTGGGFKQHEPALGDFTLSLTMMYDPYDQNMIAFLAASYNRLPVQMMVMDQESLRTAGSQGIAAVYKVFKQSRKEGVDGIMEQMFEFKPCYSLIPPQFYQT